MIDIQNVSKYYDGHHALEDINLQIKEGEWVGLVGENGAGKTTLIKILSTLLRPDAGKIIVDGLDVEKKGKKVRALLGVVTQKISLDPDLTVAGNLYFAASLYGMSRSKIKKRIAEYSGHLKINLDAKIKELSGGNQRLVDILRALLHQPKVLLLDEATTGLDFNNRNRIWELIQSIGQKNNLTVISTTHYLEEAARCTRITALRGGKVANADLPLEQVESWLAESNES